MMVLMAKLPSKVLPLASVYRPTAQVHAANDTVMVRGYKHTTGTARHAHTETCPILPLVAGRGRPGVGPAGCLSEGRISSIPSPHPPNSPSAGRLAVLTPGQYTPHPRCPHLIRTLQRVVDEVSLPMGMPGLCSGTTPILVQGPGGPRAGAPAPRVEATSCK